MTAKRWGFALALLLVRLQEVKLAETNRKGTPCCALAFISFAGARQRLAARTILFREVADLDRLLKPEVESCFRRDADLLALGGCLNRGARGGAHAGPNRRALAATGNRADGRADGRATANCDRGALAPRGSDLLVLIACQRVRLALELHPHQLQAKFAAPAHVSCRACLHQLDVHIGAGRHDDVAVRDNRPIQRGLEDLAAMVDL